MRDRFSSVMLILAFLALFTLASCGGDSPDEGEVRQVYNDRAKCYLKSEFGVDDNLGLTVPEQPTNGCGNPDAVGDVWLYTVRYNKSDPQNEKSIENLKNMIGPNCEKLPASPWGNRWELFKEAVYNPASGSTDEDVFVMVCGWTERSGGIDTDLSKKIGDQYQARVARIGIANLPGYDLLGPGCTAYTNGWFYSQSTGSSQGFCVSYYQASGSFESCNDNRSICINLDYEIGVPQHSCNSDSKCDSPWESESDCGDCRIDCNARAVALPQGPVTFDELISSNKDAILQCQGDLNSPGYISSSYLCKMCPKTHASEPFLPGREWLPTSWAFPWSTPAGSYSNDDENTAWGCVNVAEGSPMNCGVCGFKDVLPQKTIENTLDYLAGGFCAATYTSNNVFCADSPNPGRMEYRCVSPGEARGNPSSSPWFSKYPANPSYFYNVVAVGTGWKSTVTPINCQQ